MSLFKKIRALEAKPLMGNAPPFPMEALQKGLQERFALPDLTIELQVPEWKEELSQGKRLYVQLTETPIIWTGAITALLPNNLGEINDESLVEGLLQFCALEVLRSLEIADYPTFRLLEGTEIPAGPYLAYQVSMKSGNHTAYGELSLPKAAHQEWIAYFANQGHHFTEEQMRNLPIRVSVAVGTINLPYQEWEGVKAGDFISIDSQMGEGEVLLMLKDKTLCRGKMRAEGVEIT